MKKNILLVLVLVGMNVWAKAQQVTQLQSPDKSIALNVFLSASGEIQYTVKNPAQLLFNLRQTVLNPTRQKKIDITLNASGGFVMVLE